MHSCFRNLAARCRRSIGVSAAGAPAHPARRALAGLAVLASLAGTPLPAPAQEAAAEQAIYLPIYSHIYYGDLNRDGKPEQRLMSAHVSIRNTDPRASIRVLYAHYYDTDGKLLRNFLPAGVTVPPMGTAELFVPRSDASGGSGANFVIGWRASGAVSPPMVEAVHVAFEASRTLTFTTAGRVVQAR